jgi:hypothetical protein
MLNATNRWDDDRYCRPEEYSRVEKLAQKLAEMAGVNWEALTNYPGYEKGRWRAMAGDVIAATMH